MQAIRAPRVRIAVLTSVAALIALATIAGSALAAAKLTLKTAGKGALPKGAVIVASSPGLTFTESVGKIECTTNTITAAVELNQAATDKATVSEGGIISKGTEEFGGKKELCKSSTGLGPFESTWHNFPYESQFRNKCELSTKCAAGEGENAIKSLNATVKDVEFQWTFPEAGGAECWYQSAKVVSKFPLNSSTVTLSTTEQKFTSNKTKSNAACAKEGKLNGTWTTESEGETLEDENK